MLNLVNMSIAEQDKSKVVIPDVLHVVKLVLVI